MFEYKNSLQIYVEIANYDKNSIEVNFSKPNEIRLVCEAMSKSGYVQYYLSYLKFFRFDENPYDLNNGYHIEFIDNFSFRIFINKTEKFKHHALVSLDDESFFVEINQDSIDIDASEKSINIFSIKQRTLNIFTNFLCNQFKLIAFKTSSIVNLY